MSYGCYQFVEYSLYSFDHKFVQFKQLSRQPIPTIIHFISIQSNSNSTQVISIQLIQFHSIQFISIVDYSVHSFFYQFVQFKQLGRQPIPTIIPPDPGASTGPTHVQLDYSLKVRLGSIQVVVLGPHIKELVVSEQGLIQDFQIEGVQKIMLTQRTSQAWSAKSLMALCTGGAWSLEPVNKFCCAH